MIYSSNPELYSITDFIDVHGSFVDDEQVLIAPFHTQAISHDGRVTVYGWKRHQMWANGSMSGMYFREVIGSINLKKNGEVGNRSKGDVPSYVHNHKWQDGDVIVEGWQLGWKFSDDAHKARVFIG